MIFALVLLVSLALVPFIYWYYLVNVRYASFKKLPGPKPIPVLGSIMASDTVGILKDMQELYDKYKPRYVVWTGPQVRVFHSSSEHIAVVLNSNVNTRKSNNFEVIKGWIGNGLAASSGELWRQRRRMLNHSFNINLFERFLKVFNSASDELNRSLAEHVGEECTELIELTNYTALGIAADNLMGVKLNFKDSSAKDYLVNVKALLQIIGVRIFSFWQRNESLFLMFSSQKKIYMHYCNAVKQFTIRVLEERIKIFEKEKETPKKERVNEIGTKKRLALIDVLLEEHEKGSLTYRDICEELDTFMAAGHETSAGLLSFTLFELARHPEHQNVMYDEIMSVVPKGDISSDHLSDMEYTEMVVKEALRMYPQVPFIERQIDEQFELDGIVYPKKTVFGIPIINLHYDPEYFPNPHQFDPERFTKENYQKVPRYVYLPFSAGPRICIGYKYAMWSAKVVLAKVIREYEVLPVPGFEIQLEFQVTLKSTTGVCVRLKKRTNNN